MSCNLSVINAGKGLISMNVMVNQTVEMPTIVYDQMRTNILDQSLPEKLYDIKDVKFVYGDVYRFTTFTEGVGTEEYKKSDLLALQLLFKRKSLLTEYNTLSETLFPLRSGIRLDGMEISIGGSNDLLLLIAGSIIRRSFPVDVKAKQMKIFDGGHEKIVAINTGDKKFSKNYPWFAEFDNLTGWYRYRLLSDTQAAKEYLLGNAPYKWLRQALNLETVFPKY